MKKIFSGLLGVVLSFVFTMQVSAYTDISATAKKYYPGTYFNTSTQYENVTSSSLVMKDSAIPSDYSFALGYVGKNFGSKLVKTGVDAEAIMTSYMSDDSENGKRSVLVDSGFITKDGTRKTYVTRAEKDDKSNVNNKFSVRYNNAGKYNGKVVDVVLTVVDYETLDVSDNGSSNDGVKPMIALGKNRIDVNVLSIAWVEVKYDFYVSGTNTPISVMGRTSYWDIDQAQGILFENNNKGLYTPSDSLLKIKKIDNKPYVFDLNIDDETKGCSHDYSDYDTRGVVIETFEGTSITRLFSYSKCHVKGEKDTNGILKVWTGAGTMVNTQTPFASFKSYAEDTKAGSGSEPVKVGDEIKYSIDFANTHDSVQNAVITDTLSKGLEYVAKTTVLNGTAYNDPTITKNDDGTTTLKWTISTARESDNNISYTVKVLESAKIIVDNGAKVKIGSDKEVTLSKLKNPIPVKEYYKDTKAGLNGAEVKVNDIISYSIKYANPFQTSKIKVVLTDTMSKGLEYVPGSTVVNGKKFDDPKITKNDDGTTVLVWNEEIEADGERELVYEAKVIGGVEKVENTAKIKFGNFDEYQLQKLINPLKPDEVKVPDTGMGRNMFIIILGIGLIAVGSFFGYKKIRHNN